MDALLIIAICLLAVLCCGVSVKIAIGKRRSPVLWGLVGLLLNLLGLLIVVFVPGHRAEPHRAEPATAPAQGTGRSTASGPKAATA